jgi:hypothetical protein
MQSKWTAELFFWLIAIVIALLVMRPVHEYIEKDYEFYTINYVFIVLFLSFSRYILLLKYTPFSHNAWIKLILLFSCIPLFLFLIDGQYNFHQMLDEKGLEPIVKSQNLEFRWNIAKYTKYQFLFFSTGTIITLIIMPIRMIISIWKVRNKGTV